MPDQPPRKPTRRPASPPEDTLDAELAAAEKRFAKDERVRSTQRTLIDGLTTLGIVVIVAVAVIVGGFLFRGSPELAVMIIGLILGIFTLVKFLGLCRDVRAIREHLVDRESDE